LVVKSVRDGFNVAINRLFNQKNLLIISIMATQTTTPSPNLPIGIFFLLTIPYFFLQYKAKKEQEVGLFIAYLILLLSSQLYINMQISSGLCGSTQTKTAFFITIIPWLIIFGLLNIVLAIFPGWLIPFSNTFGYGIAKLAGLNKLLIDKILKKESDKASDTVSGREFSKTLGKIYDDPSLLINEIPDTDAGFEKFWDDEAVNHYVLPSAINPIKQSSQNGVKKPDLPSPKEQLRQFVKLKQIVAKFIWFALTGVLTASTSYTYLVRAGCSSSVKQMEQRHTEYERLVEEDEKDTQEPRVYTDHGH